MRGARPEQTLYTTPGRATFDDGDVRLHRVAHVGQVASGSEVADAHQRRRAPRSMRAICRAKLAVANDGACRGPMWLKGRVTNTRWPSRAARTASCSCASLLTAYGLAGASSASSVSGSCRVPVDACRSGHQDAVRPAARTPVGLEEVLGAHHVHLERRGHRLPRLPHVGGAGEVKDDRRAEVGERLAHGLRNPAVRRSRHRTPAGRWPKKAGVSGRAQPSTVRPAASRASSRWLPAKPAAPVTSTGPVNIS